MFGFSSDGLQAFDHFITQRNHLALGVAVVAEQQMPRDAAQPRAEGLVAVVIVLAGDGLMENFLHQIVGRVAVAG